MRILNQQIFFILCSCLLINATSISARENLRIGALAFGTLDWELTTIESRKLNEKYDFVLEKRPLANPEAGKIALQSESVDLIISDWIWVSAQRSKGFDFSFSPYSSASGSLMVSTDSGIESVEDLAGKRLGIAGGELDKNWLLLVALARKTKNIDLDAQVEKVFGAAPLLNQQLLRKDLDALLTYWHYAARLEASGYHEILNGNTIMAGLGIDLSLPTLGYVFRAQWAQAHRELLRNFLQAAREARNLLCESDADWDAIASLTAAQNPEIRKNLRQKYCAGRVDQFDDRHREMAAKVFGLLHEVSGARLAGPSPTLAEGTFWNE